MVLSLSVVHMSQTWAEVVSQRHQPTVCLLSLGPRRPQVAPGGSKVPVGEPCQAAQALPGQPAAKTIPRKPTWQPVSTRWHLLIGKLQP